MLSKLLSMLEDSRKDIGRFWCPGSKKKWWGTHANKPDGKWDKSAEGMMLNFAESAHPVFRASSDLERGELKSKGKRSELHSLQLQWCNHWVDSSHSYFRQSAQRLPSSTRFVQRITTDSSGAVKPAANDNLESMAILTEFPTAGPISQTDAEVQRKLLREYDRKFAENFLNNRNWPNSAPTLVFRRILTKDTSSLHLMRKDLTIWNDHVESTLYLERRKHPVWEGGFVETRRSAQSWMWRSAIIKDVAVLRSWSNLYCETKQFLGFVS